MENKKKAKYYGIAGTALIHVALIAMLLLLAFSAPVVDDEVCGPVMIGRDTAWTAQAADDDLWSVAVLTQNV